MANKNPTNTLDVKNVFSSAMPVYLQDGLQAARVNAIVCGWINAQDGLDALTVIDNAGLYYNLEEDTRVVITMVCAGLNTVSDDVNFQLGYTDQPDATGNFVPIMPYKRYGTGANKDGHLDYELKMPIPAVVRYSDGARCITFRVQANDADAEVDLAWQGWVEYEYK